MGRYNTDADDVLLAVLRPEEEREMSFAAAKAALTAEKWSTVEDGSLHAHAQKMLRLRSEKLPKRERRAAHE
ncbi:MAG: hypothetical protein LBI16_04725 [Burkholderiales bacterium]|jgi:hypothetical protein|nr:hypothetical protein [Burkholderiales bacterium]